MKVNKQVVGNAGLYYVCYQLSLRGWNVMPTARNAKGIDIVAYREDISGFIGIQVKALSKRNPVPLGNTLDNVAGDFGVVINNLAKEKPETFVLRPEEVKERSQTSEKDGQVSYWLQPPDYGADEFRDAWDRIGRGDQAT